MLRRKKTKGKLFLFIDYTSVLVALACTWMSL